jgi:hypothetical protein
MLLIGELCGKLVRYMTCYPSIILMKSSRLLIALQGNEEHSPMSNKIRECNSLVSEL